MSQIETLRIETDLFHCVNHEDTEFLGTLLDNEPVAIKIIAFSSDANKVAGPEVLQSKVPVNHGGNGGQAGLVGGAGNSRAP